jgi:hypothetical protein
MRMCYRAMRHRLWVRGYGLGGRVAACGLPALAPGGRQPLLECCTDNSSAPLLVVTGGSSGMVALAVVMLLDLLAATGSGGCGERERS